MGPLVGRRDLTSREIKIQGSFSKKKKKKVERKDVHLPFLSFFLTRNSLEISFKILAVRLK